MSRMHARILRYLDEVARSGSIRAAAEKLHVAPSAISRQIKTLEGEIQTPIFSRNSKEMILTAAGELLLLHIRETLRNETRTLAQIEDLKGLRRGEITLAVMSGIAGNIVPDSIAAFQAENPRVSLKVQLLSTGEAILEAVGKGNADLGLGFDFPERFGVMVHAVSMAHLGAVVRRDHPLAERSSLHLSDCVHYPLILADASMVLRPYLDQALAPLRGTPEILVETNSIEVMRQMTRNSQGITFLTQFDVRRELENRTLVHIPIQEFSQMTQRLMIIGSGRHTSALTSVYLEALKAFLLDS